MIPDGRPLAGPVPGRRLDEDELVAALELAHVFPCRFPVVLIAPNEPDFRARLAQLVAELQEGREHSLSMDLSRHGRYAAYRLELYVESARQAVRHRARLAGLAGVVLLL